VLDSPLLEGTISKAHNFAFITIFDTRMTYDIFLRFKLFVLPG